MRHLPTTLLLAAAFAACGPCTAQQRRATPPVERASVGRASVAADEPAPSAGDDQGRSAFGRVMAVMIASLQRQPDERAQPQAPVRTADTAGAPPGIEVGEAFRTALDHAEAAGPMRDDASAAAPDAAASAAQAYPAREATLAGPG